jgi:hypothetical protein
MRESEIVQKRRRVWKYAILPMVSTVFLTAHAQSLNKEGKPTLPAGVFCSQMKQMRPLISTYEDSLLYTIANKKPSHSELLKITDSLAGWTVDGIAEIVLAGDQKSANPCLRFSTSMYNRDYLEYHKGPKFHACTGGATMAYKSFPEPQNWERFNRIALRIFVHDTGRRTYNFTIGFRDASTTHTPLSPRYDYDIQNLKAGEWNTIYWEIPHLKRDKVSQFMIAQETCGYDDEIKGDVIYDIEGIELQVADCFQYEGWAVPADEILYCHSGYKPEDEKRAICTAATTGTFTLVKQDTEEAVFQGEMHPVSTRIGSYSIADFSGVTKPGKYFLDVNGVKSRPFLIDGACWREPLLKALNFFFCERCGTDIPGIHSRCHEDITSSEDSGRRVVNGGWHDASDFSQGTFRTAICAFSLLELHQKAKRAGADTEIIDRALDEARWGLDWLIKTQFDDGKRMSWYVIRHYTDNTVGTVDDVVAEPEAVTWENFCCAAVLSYASELFREKDPLYSGILLKTAQKDWAAAVTGLAPEDRVEYQELSWGALAAIHLQRIAPCKEYQEIAVSMGNRLLACQEQEFVQGMPFCGYFYTSPQRDKLMDSLVANMLKQRHFIVLALSKLCDEFPGDKDWIRWYSALVLYSQYYCTESVAYTEPYRNIPSGLYRESELNAQERWHEEIIQQLHEGIKLSEDCYLRIFPILNNAGFIGSTSAHLSTAAGLAACARIRNKREIEQIAVNQLEWVVGGNPFCQSLMYGEGHDFAPTHSPRQGEIVGSLTVGMDCIKNDEPYWPTTGRGTSKEIYGQPVAMFVQTAASIGFQPVVEGTVSVHPDTPVMFTGLNGDSYSAECDATGHFRIVLPAGTFKVTHGKCLKQMTFVSGNSYRIVLNPDNYCDISSRIVETTAGENKKITIETVLAGAGEHRIQLECFNCIPEIKSASVRLVEGERKTVRWDLTVEGTAGPWVVVVIPDNDMTYKQELYGP